MNNNNIGGKHWVGLDFEVASAGSPKYYRTLLRQMMGLPTLLPGETTDEIQKSAGSRQTNSIETFNRGYMPGYIHKGKR